MASLIHFIVGYCEGGRIHNGTANNNLKQIAYILFRLHMNFYRIIDTI